MGCYNDFKWAINGGIIINSELIGDIHVCTVNDYLSVCKLKY